MRVPDAYSRKPYLVMTRDDALFVNHVDMAAIIASSYHGHRIYSMVLKLVSQTNGRIGLHMGLLG
jgi:hypothetical protein